MSEIDPKIDYLVVGQTSGIAVITLYLQVLFTSESNVAGRGQEIGKRANIPATDADFRQLEMSAEARDRTQQNNQHNQPRPTRFCLRCQLIQAAGHRDINGQKSPEMLCYNCRP